MATGCYVCDREAEFDRLPLRERIAYDDHWRVAHAFGTALLGWLVLVPRRHVMELADLSDEEARSLGVWQVRLARAFAAELGIPKTYVAEFGEAPGFHLHFHVVPRRPDFEPSMVGPNVFSLLGRGEDEQVSPEDQDDLAEALSARLIS